MVEKTAIAWCDHTFNPWVGCTKVGPGCDHCYAETLDKRMWYGKAVHWGAGVPRYRTSASNWEQPLKWNKKAAADGKRHLVFCASLADVFDNEVSEWWRIDLFTLIEQTPNLSWLLVTKRIGNVEKMIPGPWRTKFPDHVRLLITICTQEEADRDIPKLLALPCKNGISYEPALGDVDWSPWLTIEMWQNAPDYGRRLDWIIVGGESGPKARPMDIAWPRSTIAQCKAAGVPVFVKQDSGPRSGMQGRFTDEEWALKEFPT